MTLTFIAAEAKPGERPFAHSRRELNRFDVAATTARRSPELVRRRLFKVTDGFSN